MVLSLDAETIFLPSRLYVAEKTLEVCPVKVCKHAPVFASHIFIFLSSDTETIFLPSGLYETNLTQFLCPFKVCKHVPVFASHIFMV